MISNQIDEINFDEESIMKKLNQYVNTLFHINKKLENLKLEADKKFLEKTGEILFEEN